MKDTLKKRLEEAKGAWPEQLPEVLWSYRTSHRTTTGHTQFSLAYGYEAMLPVELDLPSHRRMTYDQDQNSQLLMESLDLVEEKREKAQLLVAVYQQKVARYFNSKEKESSASGIGTSKSFLKHPRPSCWSTWTKLGRTLPD